MDPVKGGLVRCGLAIVPRPLQVREVRGLMGVPLCADGEISRRERERASSGSRGLALCRVPPAAAESRGPIRGCSRDGGGHEGSGGCGYRAVGYLAPAIALCGRGGRGGSAFVYLMI